MMPDRPAPPAPRDPIILADFERCRPAEALGTTFGRGRWRLLPYRADGVVGHLLGAGEESAAPEVAYPLERKGRFRISVGIFNGFWRPYKEQRVQVRLSDEPDWSTLALPPPSDLPWGIPLDDDEAGPRISEVPWKTADLTGRDLLLRQPSTAPYASRVFGALGSEVYVAYIRLDPVDDKAPTEPADLELFAYNDTWDGYFERGEPLTVDQGRETVRAAFAPYRGTDFRRMYWEIAHGEVAHFPTRVGRHWDEFTADAFPRAGDRLVVETWRGWRAAGYDPTAEAVVAARDAGLELHATYRFGWGVGYWPPPFDAYNAGGLLERHPEWRVRRRDGTLDTALSFAYPEVRGFVVALLREVAERYPVDGLALLFNRQPPFVGDDPPLVESFRAAGGANPTELPPDDPAWLRHRAGAVTALVREVRAMLDDVAAEGGRGRLPLTTWVFGTEADNLRFGLDVEAWVREGLIDTVIPYSSQAKGFSWGPSWTTDAEIAPWRALTNGTGTLLAPNVMPRDMDDAGHRRVALGLARAGIRALAFWDTGGRRALASGVLGRLGHVDELEAWEAAGEPVVERTTRRILEVAGWRFEHLPE